ncbi:MAG: hypothetical protein V1664_00820 [Candidatus Uhrbacteria bacterium]
MKTIGKALSFAAVLAFIGLLGFFAVGRVAVWQKWIDSQDSTTIDKMGANLNTLDVTCRNLNAATSSMELADSTHNMDGSLVDPRPFEEAANKAEEKIGDCLAVRDQLREEAGWGMIKSAFYGTLAYTHYRRWYCADSIYDSRANSYVDLDLFPEWVWNLFEDEV